MHSIIVVINQGYCAMKDKQVYEWHTKRKQKHIAKNQDTNATKPWHRIKYNSRNNTVHGILLLT